MANLRSPAFSLFALRSAARYTSDYEYSDPTECEVCANARLPRHLRQQRADSRECMGLFPGFWDHAASLGGAGGTAKLSGNLSQPAAGQGADGAFATEWGELGSRFRRDQTGSAGPVGPVH